MIDVYYWPTPNGHKRNILFGQTADTISRSH